MQYKFGAMSHVGKVRSNNEDSYKIGQNYAIVADGMGGHNKGEVASKMAVDIISDFITAKKCGPVQAVEAANKEIFKKGSKAEFAGMGTTAVVCVFEEDKALIANVGDSRGYILRNGELKQITKDHSLIQKLIDEGEITEEEAELRADKSVILRAVGADKDIKVDVFENDVFEGDRILLCTDGLTNCVDKEEITKTLAKNISVQKKTEELIEKANEKGGFDNITAVLLEIRKV